jgi:hypothetical protein
VRSVLGDSLHLPMPDELHDVIADAALPPSLRSAFRMQVPTAGPAEEEVMIRCTDALHFIG